MTFSNPITGGQGALVRPAIKSPDYVPGVSGWSINRDGTAEFNDLTIRGTFNGNDFILNTSGFFLYSGTPAAGNLVASAAPTAGTDEFGNEYGAGFCTYGIDTFDMPITSQLLDGAVNFSQPGWPTFEPGGIQVTSLSGNDSFRLAVAPPTSGEPDFDAPSFEMYTSSESLGVPSEIQVYSEKFSLFPGTVTDEFHFFVNFIEQGWGPVDFVARQTNSGTTTTAELVVLTSDTVDFYPNRAYKISVHGLVQSTVAADRVHVRIWKNAASGSSLMDSGQIVIPAASTQVLCDLSVVVITNSTPPTDVVVMSISRTAGTGNVSVIANATNPAYLKIEDIGTATDFPDARLLT